MQRIRHDLLPNQAGVESDADHRRKGELKIKFDIRLAYTTGIETKHNIPLDSVDWYIDEEFLYDDEITDEKGALHMALVDKVTKDYKEFWAIPTSWELAAETGDMATYSASFTVIGKPLKKSNFTTEVSTTEVSESTGD